MKTLGVFDLTRYGQTPSNGRVPSSSPLFDLDHYSQTTDAGQTDCRLACIHFKRWFRSDRLSVDACHPVVGVRLALDREAQLLHVLRAGATSKTTGNDFIADTMDMSLVDRVIKITDSEAFENARELAKKEGIIAGSSSGAALAAAKKLISSGARGNIVIILPDRGDRYFTKNLYE